MINPHIPTTKLLAMFKVHERADNYRTTVTDPFNSVTGWAFYCRLTPGTSSCSAEGLYSAYREWTDRHKCFAPHTKATRQEFDDILMDLGFDQEDATMDMIWRTNKPLPQVLVPSRHKHKAYYQLDRKRVKRENRKYIDYDYLAKLSAHDSLWLSKFTDEWYNNHLYNDGTDMLSPKQMELSTEQYVARKRDYLGHPAQVFSYDDEVRSTGYNEDILVDMLDGVIKDA